MKIAICEDNPVEAEEIERIVKNWALESKTDLSVVWYPTAEAFWFSYEDQVFDALFLDIQMPGEDGISLAKRLREQGDRIPIVFVTGIDDFISEGYDVEAVHYLLKPVREKKVAECLERICQKQTEFFVLLSTEDGVVKVSQRDILKIEVFGHHCVYTTVDGTYKVTQSLKEARKNLLPDRFVLCYRGILVNLQNIESINHSQVNLTGGIQAPVSRRMYGEINQAFIRFFQQQ